MATAISDLEKQRMLEESKLIAKCQKAVLKGKMTDRQVRDHSTHVKWELKQGDIEISFENGFYWLGDGKEMKVVHRGEEVLLVYDDSFKRHKYQTTSSFETMSGLAKCHVGKYNPGEWEEKIEVALN